MSEKVQPAGHIRPAQFQSPLPTDRLILHDTPDPEAVPMDVVFVGGGPAGLAGAIDVGPARAEGQRVRAVGWVKSRSGSWRRLSQLGEHSLSGAVVNPVALHELFPELDIGDLPLRGRVGKGDGLLPYGEEGDPDPHAPHNEETTATTWPRSARSCGGWERRPRASASTCFLAFRWMDCWSKPTVSSVSAPPPLASTAKAGRARTTCRPWI